MTDILDFRDRGGVVEVKPPRLPSNSPTVSGGARARGRESSVTRVPNRGRPPPP